MRYGRTVEKGALAVFSVDTEHEARRLLSFSCATNMDGDHIASELVKEQTLDNLDAFSDRLQRAYDFIQELK